MQPQIADRRRSRIGLYLLVIAIAFAAWHFQGQSTSFFAPELDKPTDWQKLSVSVASETTRLLTTLGTGLLGALGLLMGGGGGGGKARHLWAAFACAACAGVSLFYGYVVHLHLLWMIAHKTLDTTSAFFVTPSYYQFYALLAAGLFFAHYAAQNVGEGK